MRFLAPALLLAASLAALPTASALAQAPAPAAASRLNLDTPIEALLADAAGKAVLVANLPGIDVHPSLDMFKAMSLRQVQPFSQGQITDAILEKIGKELAAIK